MTDREPLCHGGYRPAQRSARLPRGRLIAEPQLLRSGGLSWREPLFHRNPLGGKGWSQTGARLPGGLP
jgi:hypothetical protein